MPTGKGTGRHAVGGIIMRAGRQAIRRRLGGGEGGGTAWKQAGKDAGGCEWMHRHGQIHRHAGSTRRQAAGFQGTRQKHGAVDGEGIGYEQTICSAAAVK